jgi:hypothetical protein
VKKSLLALAGALAFGGPAFAANGPAAGQDTFSLDIQGFVPVICRANVSATQVPSEAGQVSIGQLSQFCNDPNGYQVWIDYSPSLADASVSIDGRQVSLSQAGSTLISTSNKPSVEQHDLGLNLHNPGVQGSISIRVVAL